jgi:peptidoglycan/xylan/chitin deacetylase (PgdA/CDA1 family)
MNGKSRLAAKWLSRFGFYQALHRLQGKNRLTVLNYHRIADANAADFIGYTPNVSTDASGFAAQMKFVSKHFSVISLDTLVSHLVHGTALPDYPLLITFDDGYLDNYETALPILKQYQLPAVIFLMTSRMTETSQLPWWDACAEAIRHTEHEDLQLPQIGHYSLRTPSERKLASDRLISALKLVPEAEKTGLLKQIVETLEVDLSLKKPLFVNWEQVRELVAHQVACQAHTHNHPILTRITEVEIREELKRSSQLIAEETGQKISAFAYPNGTSSDYDERVFRVLSELNFQVAFTLLPGTMPAKDLKRYRFQIKRIFLSHTDGFDIFQSKMMGVPALLSREPYQLER